MRILTVHNEYRHPGGEEQSIVNLENQLISHGHVVEKYRHASREWASHASWARITDAAKMIYSFSTAKEISNTIRSFKPDLAHIHNVFPVISPSVYMSLHEFKIPIVQSLHNYRFLCVNGLFLTPKGVICERCKLGNFWTAVTYGCYGGSRWQSLAMAATLAIHRRRRTLEKSIDQYIAPSQFVVQKLSEAGFPSDRISVIPNIATVASTTEPRSASPLFVYAGRLSREKGLWTLLRAFESLKDTQLVLLGEGPVEASLRDYVKEKHLNHIRFEGHVSRELISLWLSRAWNLIMPSECYENMPQAILESWTCGTPVIVSHLGGLAEMIQNNDTARSFVAGSAESLRDEIQRSVLQGPPSKQTAANCITRIHTIHNNDRIYDKHMVVYEKAISTHREP